MRKYKMTLRGMSEEQLRVAIFNAETALRHGATVRRAYDHDKFNLNDLRKELARRIYSAFVKKNMKELVNGGKK